MTQFAMSEEEAVARGLVKGDAESSRTAAQGEGVQDTIVRDRLFDLRDYFAGQALCGMLTRGSAGETSAAEYAYRYADAMLKERNKP